MSDIICRSTAVFNCSQKTENDFTGICLNGEIISDKNISSSLIVSDKSGEDYKLYCICQGDKESVGSIIKYAVDFLKSINSSERIGTSIGQLQNYLAESYPNVLKGFLLFERYTAYAFANDTVKILVFRNGLPMRIMADVKNNHGDSVITKCKIRNGDIFLIANEALYDCAVKSTVFRGENIEMSVIELADKLLNIGNKDNTEAKMKAGIIIKTESGEEV